MRSLIRTYFRELEERGARPNKISDLRQGLPISVNSSPALLDHLLWMLCEMDCIREHMDAFEDGSVNEPPSNKQIMKFHRWLGFVQGVFWTLNIFTLQELRNQTRESIQIAVSQ